MVLFILLSFVVVLCLIEYFLNHSNERAKLILKIPGLKRHFIFCHALHVLLTPTELFRFARRVAKEFKNGINGFWCFGLAGVNIYNPQDIEIVLSTTKHNDKSEVYKLIRPWLRDGLLLSKGSKWRLRRKILTPAFHFNILTQFITVLEENSQRLIQVMNNSEEKLDVVPLISECTLNAICETSMGFRLPNDNTGWEYKKHIHNLGKIFVERFTKIFYFSDKIFKWSLLARRQNKSLNIVHSFTKSVIAERKKYVNKYGITILSNNTNAIDTDDTYMVNNKKRRIALLDLLIQAENDNLITDVGIHEEVDTFMFEGHDTTAVGITFALMCLANNKLIQDTVVDELKNIFGDSTREATMQDFSEMKYLERCIKESLRLYPPVPFVSRNISESTKLSNYTIPAGTFCHIHIYDLHHNEDLFPDPEKFDPDRFLPENVAGRHLYSYIPFSAGPRNCIGQKFAMMEMKSVLSAVLRKFELLPMTKPEDLDFQADIVLRNSGPIMIRFRKRQ